MLGSLTCPSNILQETSLDAEGAAGLLVPVGVVVGIRAAGRAYLTPRHLFSGGCTLFACSWIFMAVPTAFHSIAMGFHGTPWD